MKMKRTCRKGLSILLTLCMVLTLIPAVAPQAQATGVVQRTTTLDLTGSSVSYSINGTTVSANPNAGDITNTSEGWSWYHNANTTYGYEANTLVLHGIDLETSALRGIYLPLDSTIVLTPGSSNRVAIVNSANGSLGYGVSVYDDSFLPSSGDLTVKGSGVLSITGDSSIGYRFMAIQVSSGTFNLESGTIYAKVSGTINDCTLFADSLDPNITAYQKSAGGDYNLATTWVQQYLTFYYNNGATRTTDIKLVNGALPTSSATVSNLTLSGKVGTLLSGTDSVTITLTDCTFEELSAEEDVSGWFSGLPAGISVSVSAADETTATLVFSGTPGATSDAAMSITIPGGKLSTEEDLTVTSNSEAKFSITPPLPTRTDALNLAGDSVSYQNSEGATITNVDPRDTDITDSREGWAWYHETSTLVLDGLNLQATGAYAIQLPEGSNILLADGSSNRVSADMEDENIQTILALGDLEVTGNTGSLLVTSGNTSSAMSSCVYVRAENEDTSENLTISGGTIRVEAGDASNASYGLYANDRLAISSATVYAKSGSVDSGVSVPIIAFSSINDQGMEIFQNVDGNYTEPTTLSGTYYFYYSLDDGSVFATDIRVSPVTASFGGTGTPEDPYQISTAAELVEMSDLVFYHGDLFANKHYELTDDIVLNEDFENDPEQWNPIGGYLPFTGVFDGNGHTISGLYIDGDLGYAGLFGYIQGGTVRNLGLVDGYVASINTTGGIVGCNRGGTVENCYNTGSVSGTIAGGIVGRNFDGHIQGSYNTGAVSASDDECAAGGIAGHNFNGHIQDSYNTGEISASGNECAAGGIAGQNQNAEYTIVNCYNTGSVSAFVLEDEDEGYVGGIVGVNDESSIRNCYSTGAPSGTAVYGAYIYVGGIAGSSTLDEESIIENAYWLDAPAGVGVGDGEQDGCISKTLAEMQAADFVDLLNTNVEALKPTYTLSSWVADTQTVNNGYPVFGTAAPTFTLTISGGGTGATAGGSYAAGTAVPISAGTRDGYTFNGWTTNNGGSFINAAAANTTFTMPDANVTVTAGWVRNNNGGGSVSSSSGAGGSASTPVMVNGKSVSAGTAQTKTDADGKKVTTVTIDSGRLETILAAQTVGATVTIPVTNNADRAVGTLTGQMVKSMENREAVLVVQTPDSSYTLPASQINIDAVSRELGANVDLTDITVSVNVSAPSNEMSQVVENAESTGEFTIVAPAVDFTITCTHGNRTVNVSSFNAYVERTIAIPDGVDPTKITTGVVVEPDGTVHHVPTRVTVINGKYYAVINSLTNSTYSVIWNPIEFSDVTNHWAKDSINNMGSRMVVTGIGNNTYEPDRNMTRAEFAAIMIRALGLEPGTSASSFSDVSVSEWYCGYIDTAASYGIIKGYSDDAFGPNDTITREQAMTMVARAMAITGLDASLTNGESSQLIGTYTDGTAVSEYASDSIAACLKTGVVSGIGNHTLAPKSFVTRAEVATMVERLLQKSELI